MKTHVHCGSIRQVSSCLLREVLPSSETSDTTVCQKVSLPLTWPIFDIMLCLSLCSPKKGLSCFSRPDNYFPLIPPCQGQSKPSIEARACTTSHHFSAFLFFSISPLPSVSLHLTLWLQDPLFPLSLFVSLPLSCSVSSLRIYLQRQNRSSAWQNRCSKYEWLHQRLPYGYSPHVGY